ncbi:MAG: phosphatase PAP2 family protein [Pseudomonadota bacterium]
MNNHQSPRLINKTKQAFSNPLLALSSIGMWFLALALFITNAHWDLQISALFFDAERCAQTRDSSTFCRGFSLAEEPVLRTIRQILQTLPTWLGIAVLLWFIADWWIGLRWKDTGFRQKAALTTTLIIWPLLIVNGVLKAFWGRPRPWQSEPFGGTSPFIEAGRISEHCAANCSFVSGEAASAGWLALLVFIFPPALRPLAAMILIPASIFMAGLRIGFGAHYTSDAFLGYWGSIAVFALVFTTMTRLASKA